MTRHSIYELPLLSNIIQPMSSHLKNPPGQQLSKTIRPWLAINDQIGWILGTEKAVRIGLLKLTMAYSSQPFELPEDLWAWSLFNEQRWLVVSTALTATACVTCIYNIIIMNYIYCIYITYDVYLLLEGKKVHGANGSVRSQLSWSRLLSSNSKIFALIRGFPNSSHTEESCPAIRLRLITGVTGVTLSESLYPLHDFIHILVGQGIYQPHFQIWLFQILSQGPIIASW